MGRMSKQGSSMLSNFLSLVIDEERSLAESGFTGTWKVLDTAGKPFEITLFPSGTAEANRTSEGMSGTWTEDNSSAVIDWESGWTTKITPAGEAFVKTAYNQTAAVPSDTSTAEKVA